MSWKAFEQESPEMAALGIEKLNRKIAYLARLRADGSPHLNPITPFIENGMLFMFTEPTSPKIRDLRQDGRYALHCAVSREGPLVEYLVMGKTVEITEPVLRERTERTLASPDLDETYACFEFLVERVLVVEYNKDMQKIVRRWSLSKSGHGVKERCR